MSYNILFHIRIVGRSQFSTGGTAGRPRGSCPREIDCPVIYSFTGTPRPRHRLGERLSLKRIEFRSDTVELSCAWCRQGSAERAGPVQGPTFRVVTIEKYVLADLHGRESPVCSRDIYARCSSPPGPIRVETAAINSSRVLGSSGFMHCRRLGRFTDRCLGRKLMKYRERIKYW